nr:MAG TPA: STRUCTURAL MAINTENANCE OF CHROMOSOMES PROTEIN [Bacteriophage sp.]
MDNKTSFYEVKIKNFQSIKDQVLHLKGFVAITGKSNLGKSSLRRAITSALYNDWDKAYRREGTNQPTEVTVSKYNYPDDLVYKVHMKKSDSHNDFTLITPDSEQSFPKVGKTIPEQITNLGFKLLNLDDQSINLTQSKQTDPLFLVSYRQTTQTKILNKIFNISKLESAAQLVQKDMRSSKIEYNRTLDEYNKKNNDLTELLSKQEALNQIKQTLDRLLTNLDLIYSYQDQIEQEQTLQTNLSVTTSELDNTNKTLQKLISAQKIQTYFDTLNQIDSYTQNLTDLRENISTHQTKLDRLIKAQTLQLHITKLNSYLHTIQDEQTLQTKLSNLNLDKPLYTNFDKNRKLLNYFLQIERYDNFTNQLSALTERISKGGFLMAQIQDRATAVSHCASFLDLIQDETKHQTLLVNKQNEIKIIQDEIKELESKLDRCPTCHQIINKDHSHDVR